MPRICFCVNPVARFRNIHKERWPDPAAAAIAAELAGVDGIVAAIREDRSDITDRDINVLKEVVQSHLNVVIPLNDEMVKKAVRWLPDMITLIPSGRDELPEASLDIAANLEYLEDVVATLRANNIVVSALIAPEAQQVRAAARVRLGYVQINTFSLSRLEDLATLNDQLEAIRGVAAAANKLGLGVSAGRGLNSQILREFRDNEFIEEYNLGKAIVARAMIVGLKDAITSIRSQLEK